MSVPSWVEVNGASHRYLLTGSGPRTLVLIHELGGNLHSWDRVVSMLPKDIQILQYDMRGAGLSEKLVGEANLDQMADDLKALIQAVGIKAPVMLMGAAVGCLIAVHFTDRYPDSVEKLILLGPALGIMPERREFALSVATRLDEGGARAVVPDVIPRAFPEDLWESEAEKKLVLARWLGNDHRGYAALYRMLIFGNVRPLLPGIRCPVLAVAGKYDPAGTPEIVERDTKVVPDVTFKVIEGGHFSHCQSPGRVAEAVIPFLKQ